MSYYVIKHGRNNVTLFLIDRSKNKKHWWTINLFDAMEFQKESAAHYSAKRLKYGSIEVITKSHAQRIERDETMNNATLEEHPFSSEALGQK